jgi:hypothetical protein
VQKTDDDLESYWAIFKPLARGKGRRLNLTGRIFTRLTVEGPTGRRTPTGSALWACLCACGNRKEVSTNSLMRGKVKSCGCLLRKKQGKEPHDLQLATNPAVTLKVEDR